MSFRPGADGHVTALSRGRAAADVRLQPPWMAHFRSEALTSVRKAPVRDLLCHVGGSEACLTPLARLGRADRVVEL